MADQLYRLYAPEELGRDGYPPEWHATIKHDVRAAAGHRCVRCHHPFVVGESGRTEAHPNGDLRLLADGTTAPVMVNLSRCDDQCRHGGPVHAYSHRGWSYYDGPDETIALEVYALWRILTVHHLDGNKANCRWWNLAAVCQRDHLYLQGRVRMDQVWPWEHSDWFKPFAAGFYASRYLGLELTREETMARLDELLDLERQAGSIR